MDEHEALLPKNKTRVVERGALKTILIAFCGAAVLAGVAVPRGGRGGGLRGAPTALKAAALKSATENGLVRDVDPSRWAIECVHGNLTGMNTWMHYPSCKEVQHAFTDFWIDLLYNSSAIGVHPHPSPVLKKASKTLYGKARLGISGSGSG